ncbi:hypothetical protein ACFFQF_17765 [Haladaptatus pallidirubidus]|uniref:SWIM-type domain-containing protein n=1 Tax=Haladaptatus pallidirubidus TaxID=1008152 RepID=A0AAV3UQR7_9EURY|nr:hypothetical protein [Haladaptatus pallidirubidus]
MNRSSWFLKSSAYEPAATREAAETAQKRAPWEQFSFTVDAPGLVEVTNESHENPTDHQYVVSFDDVTGKLMACTCLHYVHRSAFCKHMAAVETATDNGTLTAFPLDGDNVESEGCDYDGLGGFRLRPRWLPVLRMRAHGSEGIASLIPSHSFHLCHVKCSNMRNTTRRTLLRGFLD